MRKVPLILMAAACAGAIALKIHEGSSQPRSMKREFSDAQYQKHFDSMKMAVEKLLGPMDEFVGHAIIPFEVGGPVDMYRFSKGIPGTGFATFELVEPDGTGPKPNHTGTFELVTFTKRSLPAPSRDPDSNNPSNLIELRMRRIMTRTGNYSYNAVLQPGDTCEIPEENRKPAMCLILDQYRGAEGIFEVDGHKHSLLLCIEVFRSEMEYAIKHGSEVVIGKLKEKGFYPYSDLDREPVF